MAIKKSVKTVFGIEITDAYHRVTNVSIASKNKIFFHLESSTDGKNPAFEEKMYSCDYTISGANPVAQSYHHLKTLPEFAGAVDC